MAAIAMQQGVFRFDVTSGASATTDVSSTTSGFTVGFKRNTGSHFVLSSSWRNMTYGGREVEVKVKTRVDNSTTSAYYYLSTWSMSSDTYRTVEAYSPDNTTGSLSITGEFGIAGPDNIFNTDAGKGDAQMATFTLLNNGTVTFAAVA